MYLKDLMQGEKYAFYSIVKYLVTIDGEFAKEEMNLMDEFLQEMQLEKEQVPDISPEDAIGMLKFSTPSTRKKIYIELIAATLCDEYLHIDEKEYLERIANDFLIDDELRDKLFETVNELLEIYKRMRILTETP